MVEYLRQRGCRAALAVFVLAALLLPRAARAADAEASPPPHSIRDVLDQVVKAPPIDGKKRDSDDRIASAPPPANGDAKALVTFYLRRARAAANLGRGKQHHDDIAKAAELAEPSNDPRLIGIYLELAGTEGESGTFAAETAAQERALAVAEQRDTPAVIGLHCLLARRFARIGRFEEAQRHIASAAEAAERFGKGLENAPRRELFLAPVEEARAVLLNARGRPHPADTWIKRALADIRIMENRTAAAQDEVQQKSFAAQENRMRVARVNILRNGGRLLEAEAEARQLLAEASTASGRGSDPQVLRLVLLGSVVAEQGRFAEAEELIRVALRLIAEGKRPNRTRLVLETQTNLATILANEGKFAEAEALFSATAQSVGDDHEIGSGLIEGNPRRVVALLGLHRPGDALPIAEARVATSLRRYGDAALSTAFAYGLRGATYAQLGRRDEAAADFAVSLPRLLRQPRLQRSDDGMLTSSERLRRTIFEAAIAFATTPPGNDAGEAFRYADVARGLYVAAALQAAALRGDVGDPALAELVRKDQDLVRERAAVREIMARSSGERNSADLAALQKQIADLDNNESTLRGELGRRFPGFNRLVDPLPAGLDEARAALRPGEALVAYYAADDRLYAWALTKEGPLAFAASEVGAAELGRMVQRLRHSLDSDVDTIVDLPPFDVALANKLYKILLEPVAAGWAGAKTLVVVPHAALAQLPFGLLVDKPVAPPGDAKGKPTFTGYRTVPFLIREVAVAELPSVAALVTLRELPPGPASREPFAGFADPWFTPEQAAEARRRGSGDKGAASQPAAIEARGLKRRAAPTTGGLSSAGLAALPRLPDTATEVREVAAALQADPQRDLFLGPLASEQRVRTMKLDDRRIVMFATHGLIPGDLDGLTEPALALSAPKVAGGEGDGLLTVEKILGLKLNADWVILSACNTAAGNGAGAEAVSGLGRAFFYAGARALLVTNWAVETRSARLLTTQTIRIQTADPQLSRAEALRRAMLHLIDVAGVRDGDAAVSYAHPIFWAPFSLIGDGG